jgi:hypothetical protein
MTRRPRAPRDDYETMFRAADRYRARFGQAPPTSRFAGKPRELARELDAAVERGAPVTARELYERIGVPPPPDAIL